MASPRVVVQNNFKALASSYQRAEKRALGVAAAATVTAARGKPSQYDIGGIQAATRATPVHSIRRGWRVIVYNADYRSIFFEKGTYQGRRAKLKQARKPGGRRRAELGNKGVKAQRFLSRAKRVGQEVLLQEIRREFRG